MVHPWEQHIRLDDSLGEYKALVEQALDDLWSTPEGRDLIEHTHVQWPFGVVIGGMSYQRPISLFNIPLPSNPGSQANGNIIRLNFDEISHMRFETTDGTFRPGSITETLAHELFHCSDSHTKVERSEELIVNTMLPFVDSHIHTTPPLDNEGRFALAGFMLEQGILQMGGGETTSRQLNELFGKIINRETLSGQDSDLLNRFRDAVNHVGSNFQSRNAIKELLDLDSFRFTRISSRDLVHGSRAIYDALMRDYMSREELATDFTDYLMLRYFGVEPRENYANGTLLTTDADRTDLSILPQRIPEPPSPTRAVLEEAQEYSEASLGRLDVPSIPQISTTQSQRR